MICAICGCDMKRGMSYVVKGSDVCYACYRESNGQLTLEILDRRLKAVEAKLKQKESEKQ